MSIAVESPNDPFRLRRVTLPYVPPLTPLSPPISPVRNDFASTLTTASEAPRNVEGSERRPIAIPAPSLEEPAESRSPMYRLLELQREVGASVGRQGSASRAEIRQKLQECEELTAKALKALEEEAE